MATGGVDGRDEGAARPPVSQREASGIVVRRLERAEHGANFEAIASLRITVFRDWPYLYEGDIAYERAYLAASLDAPGAVVIGAFHGERLIGASTAAPLGSHHGEFAQPLQDRGLDPDDYFYFGESVVLPAFRGRGIGVRFFEEREKAALQQRFTTTLFASVIRPAAHPAHPAGYQPLDSFWMRRGYERMPGLTAHYSWRDVGDAEETPKPMEFWRRHLV
jgi:GNAT superfamily N-acetyltransferase